MQPNKLTLSADQTKSLSKIQAKFNTLVLEIENLKKHKIELETNIKNVEIKYRKQIIPLATQGTDKMLELLDNINDAYDNFKLTKKEMEAVSRYMLNHVVDYLEADQFDEAQTERLKAYYEKYSGYNFEEIEGNALNNKAEMFEKMFGIKVDPEQMNDEEYVENLRKEMFEKFGANDPNSSNGSGPKKEKKKTKKQLEKENLEKEAEDNLKKDARSIYTQLAKLLHPDLEQDEILREQKSEIMKRVTNAYSSNDLYELLQIQLEVQQLDNEKLFNVSDDLMKNYVQILQKQVNELNMQINLSVRMNPVFQQFFTHTGKFSDAKFRTMVNKLKQQVEAANRLIISCRKEKDFKDLAKQLVIDYKNEDRYGGFGFDIFG